MAGQKYLFHIRGMLCRNLVASTRPIIVSWQPAVTRLWLLRRYSDESSERALQKKESKDLKKKQEYVPKLEYPRISYEYPPPPGGKDDPFRGRPPPKQGTAIRKHMPVIIGAFSLLYVIYAYKHFVVDGGQDSNSSEGLATILKPESFAKYRITYKENISKDLALIELSPNFKYHHDIVSKGTEHWNGKRLWSVEVKQPQLQVVRRYTPLPMYYMQYVEDGEPRALLKLLGKDVDEGRMVILVKRYSDGEVSRYLHGLPVGSEVELRGPFVEYKFPYTPLDLTEPRDPMLDVPSRMAPEYDYPPELPLPENIAFFAGGTGIAPALQALFSRNPPKGFMDVYFSAKDRSEIPFKRFLLFLEATGRAKFHYFVDNEQKFISEKDIPEAVPKKFTRFKDTKLELELEHEAKVQKIMEDIKKERELGIQPEKLEPSKIADTTKVEEVKSSPVKEVVQVAKSQVTPSKEKPNPRIMYHSRIDQVLSEKPIPDGPSLAIVCGPEGYIQYLTGPRGINNDQPIRGLMGPKKWTTENTHRSDA